jgi:hypothetical protein
MQSGFWKVTLADFPSTYTEKALNFSDTIEYGKWDFAHTHILLLFYKYFSGLIEFITSYISFEP